MSGPATAADDLAWLSYAEAAAALRISTRTLQRRTQGGQIPAAWRDGVRVVGVRLSDQMNGADGIHPATVSAMLDGLQTAARESRQLAAAVAVQGGALTEAIERNAREAVADARRSRRVAWAVAVASLGMAVWAWQARAEARQAAAVAYAVAQAATEAAEAARTELITAKQAIEPLPSPAMGAVSGQETPAAEGESDRVGSNLDSAER